MAVFLDTSAFLKLYLVEKGSVWLKSFVNSQEILISQLAIAESATALGALYRNGNLGRKNASGIYGQLYNDRAKCSIMDLVLNDQLDQIIKMSFNLPANIRIRALDAIQLTSAYLARNKVQKQSSTQPFTFVSADAQLIRAAQAQGFATENPEDHP